MLPREARKVLGIDSATSPRELRSRYRNLVKQLHPDGGTGDSGRLNSVLEAYRELCRHIAVEESRGPTGPSRRDATRTKKQPHRPPTEDGGSASEDAIRNDPRLLFTYGRWATSSQDVSVRRLAVARLAESGLTAAQVFLKQAIFDNNADVARDAAVGLTRINGSRTERTIIELFDQLSVDQRLAILQTIAAERSRWYRLIAYAAADHYSAVRRLAASISSAMEQS